MEYSLIRLDAGWAERYRDLRLRSLKEEAVWFSATYEEESIWPVAEFERRLEKTFTAGAICGEELLGMVTLLPNPLGQMKHKARMGAFYMAPEYRGHGASKEMLRFVLDYARNTYEQVTVMVSAENPRALQIYTSLGFEVYGVEPRANKYHGAYRDTTLMVLFLKGRE